MSIDPPEAPHLERLLNSKEVKDLLRIRRTKSIGHLGIPYVQIGNRNFYEPADVRAWIDANKKNPDDERTMYADFRERRRRQDTEDLRRAQQERKQRLDELRRDPEALARHQENERWSEGYERRKQERRDLGLPEFGRLKKGELAEARQRRGPRSSVNGSGEGRKGAKSQGS